METSKSAPESALGSALRNGGAVRSAPESTLGSTCGGFPVLGSLAGRQTLNFGGHLTFKDISLK